MKKSIFIVGALALLALASCQKEYTCICTTALGMPVEETHKGKDAESACTGATKVLQGKICVPKD